MTTEYKTREFLVARTLSKLDEEQAAEYYDILRFTIHNASRPEAAERVAKLEADKLTGYLETMRKQLAVAY